MVTSAPAEPVRLTPVQRRAWLLSAGGVALDGFDLFVMAIALPLLIEQFDPGTPEIALLPMAAIIGSVIGAGLGGRLTDKLGRRGLYIWDLSFFVVFAIATALAWDIWSIIAFRFLLGLAIGADYPIAASMSAEYLPSEVRGKWLIGGFSFQSLGMIFAGLLGVLVLLIDPSADAWRWIFGFGAVPAIVIMWGRSTVPESPSWEKQKLVKERDEPSYAELFRGENLARTGLCAGSWFTMDLLMYGVGLFTPMLLASMGFGAEDKSFITKDIAVTEGTVLLDLMFVVGFIIAIVMVERVGRMPLQKLGFLGMAVGLSLIGIANLISDPIWLIALGFAIFNLAVNAGPNSTTFLVPTEVYPTRLRATGHGFAAACGKAGAVVGAGLLPLLQTTVGVATTMFVLTGLAVGGFALTQAMGVETRGVDLDDVVETDTALFNEIERVEVVPVPIDE